MTVQHSLENTTAQGESEGTSDGARRGADRALIRTLWRPSSEALLPTIVLGALLVYFALDAPYFLDASNVANLLDQAAILGIIAVGCTFVMVAGGMDLSIGSMVALSGVVASLGMTQWSHSVAVGIVLALASGLVVGVLNAVLVIVLKVPSFIATLGTLVLLSGVALSATNNATISGMPASYAEIANANFLGLHMMVWITIASFVLGWLALHHTVFGVKTFAVGANPLAARLVGLRPNRILAINFVICSVMASVAGIVLSAQVSTAQPTIGAEQTLYAVAAVVLGGTSLFGGSGGILRTALGVLVIATVQNGLNLMGVIYQQQQAIIGLVFILGASPLLVAGLRHLVDRIVARVK